MSKKRQHPKYESITARWGGMDIRYDFGSRIDTWLNAFHEDEKKLALSLLKHFFYYSEKHIKEKASRLYDELCKGCEDPKSIAYIPPIKQYGVGYSSLFFDNFWFTNNLYDCAERNILGLLENGTIPKRIAIVDDYAGTGMTIEKTLEEMICANESVLDSTIYVVVQHITKRALTFLQTFSKNICLDLHIIYLDFSEEAFRPDYLFEQEESVNKRFFYENICQRLNIPPEQTLGFEHVQSLVSFYYNTPNNTLGLFWKDLDGFAALFTRHKRRRTTLSELQKTAKNQETLRKANPVVVGFDNKSTAAFLAYCVAQAGNFSFDKARVDFGMTVDQLNSLIDSLIAQEYLSVEEGLFSATKKTKELSFRSRFKEFKKVFSEKYEAELDFQINPKVSYIPTDF